MIFAAYNDDLDLYVMRLDLDEPGDDDGEDDGSHHEPERKQQERVLQTQSIYVCMHYLNVIKPPPPPVAYREGSKVKKKKKTLSAKIIQMEVVDTLIFRFYKLQLFENIKRKICFFAFCTIYLLNVHISTCPLKMKSQCSGLELNA